MIIIPAIYKNNVKYGGSSSSSNIDITTTLTQDTVSDTSVPSSKVVYDKFVEVDAKIGDLIDDTTTSTETTWSSEKIASELGVKVYTSLAELGLTAPVTVGDIYNAMPNKTMAILSCEDIANHITDVPTAYGVLTIKKNGVGRFSIEYQNSTYNTPCNVKKWIGTLKGADGTGLYWKQLSAEPTFITLNDIGLTADATFQDVINKLPKGGSALLGVTEFTNYQTIFPYEEGNDQFARVYIVKGSEDGSRVYARWFRKDGVKEAIAKFNINDNKFEGWQEIPTLCKDIELTKDTKVVTSLGKSTYTVGQKILQDTEFTTTDKQARFEIVTKNAENSTNGKHQIAQVYQMTPVEGGVNASIQYIVYENGKAQLTMYPHTKVMPRNDYNIVCEGYLNELIANLQAQIDELKSKVN